MFQKQITLPQNFSSYHKLFVILIMFLPDIWQKNSIEVRYEASMQGKQGKGTHRLLVITCSKKQGKQHTDGFTHVRMMVFCL